MVEIELPEAHREIGSSYENAVFKGAAGARRLQTTGDGTPSSRLMRLKAFLTATRHRPPVFSSTVLTLVGRDALS